MTRPAATAILRLKERIGAGAHHVPDSRATQVLSVPPMAIAAITITDTLAEMIVPEDFPTILLAVTTIAGTAVTVVPLAPDQQAIMNAHRELIPTLPVDTLRNPVVMEILLVREVILVVTTIPPVRIGDIMKLAIDTVTQEGMEVFAPAGKPDTIAVDREADFVIPQLGDSIPVSVV